MLFCNSRASRLLCPWGDQPQTYQLSLTCGKTVGTTKQKVYETTTIARVKAAVSKARSAKKKASRKAVSGKAGHAKA